MLDLPDCLAGTAAYTGLEIGDRGALIAFAGDIRSLRNFAAERHRGVSIQFSLLS